MLLRSESRVLTLRCKYCVRQYSSPLAGVLGGALVDITLAFLARPFVPIVHLRSQGAKYGLQC